MTERNAQSDTTIRPDLQTYDAFRQYLQHEDELNNRRMTWLLAVNGFLFAAYALTIQKKLEIAQKLNYEVLQHAVPITSGRYHLSNYLESAIFQTEWVIIIIAIVGLGISFVASRSIQAAQKAGEHVQRVFEEQFKPEDAYEIPKTVVTDRNVRLPGISGGGDPKVIRGGVLASKAIPLILRWSWLFSLAVEVILWYWRNPLTPFN